LRRKKPNASAIAEFGLFQFSAKIKTSATKACKDFFAPMKFVATLLANMVVVNELLLIVKRFRGFNSLL
jgi:hypothetical protein